MQWEFMVALVVAIPIILFPVAFVWYLNISGILQVIRDRRQRQKRLAAYEKEIRAMAQGRPTMTGTKAQERTAEKELVGTRR